MKYFKTIAIFLFIYQVQLTVPAQTRIVDSLKHVIAIADTDKEKLSAIFELNEQTLNADSVLSYINMAEAIAAKSGNKHDAGLAAYYRAGYYARKNFTDSALTILDALLDEYKNNKTQQSFYLKCLFQKSKVLDRSNQYTRALVQLYDVITEAEELKDTLTLIQARTGIGWVQMEMEQYSEALQWLYNAMHTSADKKYYKNYGALYSNIAAAHNALGNTDSARYYIDIAIEDARENENLLFLATALSMQARIFVDNKQQALAEAPLQEVLMIRKKLNDPFYIVYDMSNLAGYYANNGQADKGIALCREGIKIATESGLTSQLLMIYRALAENYKAAGNKEEYGRTLESIIAIKDSFNNINSSKMLVEMQAANEARQNELTIAEQKLNLTKKNYWIYGSSLFALMIAIIAWMGFKNYRRKQKIKMKLAIEAEKRLGAKAIEDAEVQERKRIAADLHDNLGAYAASLSSNLNYIQPSQNDSDTINAFEQIKDNSSSIISELNDTIWVLKKNALSLTAISDRIKVFISRIGKSYPGIHIDLEESIETDQELSSSQAFHLYRIVQEAVNNSFKHSKCQNIWVKISGNEGWNISIDDDGIGNWSTGKTTEGGNGLQNIRSRCRDAGWQVSWSQRQGGGTIVRVSPTTN